MNNLDTILNNSLSKIRQVGTSDPIVAFFFSNGFLQDILVPLSQCHIHLELFREAHLKRLSRKQRGARSLSGGQ